jgi:hypothetical protein
MESKSLFYLSTGIKVNNVKIKDEFYLKQKVQREFATNKGLKKQSVLQKTHPQITKINQPK